MALGLNCSFGAEKLKPHIAAISVSVPCLVSAHPNAGLPNHTGAYDESPESMASHIEKYLSEGLVNIIGGCCGSTPDHIAAITCRAKNHSPRHIPSALPPKNLLAGLEVQEITAESNLANMKDKANLAGNKDFSGLIKEGNYEDAVDITRDMAESGVVLIDVCMDDATPDNMTCFLNSALIYPDIARLPVMISSSRWDLIEAGLKCLPGKGIANFIGLKEDDTEFLRMSNLAHAYGAAVAIEYKIIGCL